jgi:hypothetical protein
MTLIPLNTSVNVGNIGSQNSLSPGDILVLNKAYSCVGRVATNAGGNYQVINLTVRTQLY